MGSRRWFLALLSVLLLFLAAPSAQAACHAFTVAVSPAVVDEGGTVRITVSRDAAVNPSSIDVSTIDESAKASSDYTPINETVSFTTETTKTLTLRTIDDAASEPAETLRVHLSNPSGCTVNPNFSMSPDAQVTIKASDAQVTTVPPSTSEPKPSVTTEPESTTTPDETSTTESGSDETTTSEATATTEDEATTTVLPDTTIASDAEPDEDDGAPVGAILAALVVAAAAVTGVAVWMRRRAAP